jgi:hypothetical protein
LIKEQIERTLFDFDDEIDELSEVSERYQAQFTEKEPPEELKHHLASTTELMRKASTKNNLVVRSKRNKDVRTAAPGKRNTRQVIINTNEQ